MRGCVFIYLPANNILKILALLNSPFLIIEMMEKLLKILIYKDINNANIAAGGSTGRRFSFYVSSRISLCFRDNATIHIHISLLLRYIFIEIGSTDL